MWTAYHELTHEEGDEDGTGEDNTDSLLKGGFFNESASGAFPMHTDERM